MTIFVRNRVWLSNLERLNYTQIPVEFPPGYWQILSLVCPLEYHLKIAFIPSTLKRVQRLRYPRSYRE